MKKRFDIIKSEQLQSAIQNWASLNISVFAIMLVTRMFFILATMVQFQLDCSHVSTILSGSIYDLLLLCHIASISLLPYVILRYYFPKITAKICNILLASFILISVLLTIYFCNMSKPLDHIIFVYSFQDIINTIFSSISINFKAIIFIVANISALILVIHYISRIKCTMTIAICLIMFTTITSACVNYNKLIHNESKFKSQTEYYLTINQISYSVIDIYTYWKNNTIESSFVDIKDKAIAYQTLHPHVDFTSYQYPFERKNNDKDVLGQFFKITETKPNFVFIIIEGFGQRLTGTERQTYSITPFIDSLSKNGLYWKNCLSSSERTFGVLPAIFASVPHGEKGFANSSDSIPYHNSLLKDFHKNGYHTSFFYGGSQSFNGQNEFLDANNISYILDVDSNTIQKNQKFAIHNRWGLDDKELFALAKKHMYQNKKSPFADVYLTLTTHEPFEFEGIETYEQQIQTEAKTIKDKIERENVEQNLNVFACFRYIDCCVRDLVNFYKSLPEYENTIFIITGDHRMCPLLVWEDPLMKYNVPLIIFSPLLQQTKTMESVISHYDITPSLNAFLSKNYNYHTNSYCHWLGGSFDTTSTFQCKKRQAFMLNNRCVSDYICDTLFICNQHLYSVGENLLIQKKESVELQNKLINELNTYQSLSKYVVKNNCLISPQSRK